MAVVGMKVLGASHFLIPQAQITAESLIRFALSCDIDVAIVGCASPAEVETLAAIGRQAVPLPQTERQYILDIFKPHAKKIAYYRGML
jgi:hypothetical protein